MQRLSVLLVVIQEVDVHLHGDRGVVHHELTLDGQRGLRVFACYVFFFQVGTLLFCG